MSSHRRYGGDGNRGRHMNDRSKTTIITQEMEGEIARWLLFTDLRKFQWFFNGLSYKEIESINEGNIGSYIKKVDKYSIKPSDRKKICAITRNLRKRPFKIKSMIAALDDDATTTHLTELVIVMRDVLECPIPNRNCVAGVELQQDIVFIMKRLTSRILREFDMIDFLFASSFLGNSIKLYMECSALVIHNQSYMKHHVDFMNFCVRVLTDRVNHMDRDFY